MIYFMVKILKMFIKIIYQLISIKSYKTVYNNNDFLDGDFCKWFNLKMDKKNIPAPRDANTLIY